MDRAAAGAIQMPAGGSTIPEAATCCQQVANAAENAGPGAGGLSHRSPSTSEKATSESNCGWRAGAIRGRNPPARQVPSIITTAPATGPTDEARRQEPELVRAPPVAGEGQSPAREIDWRCRKRRSKRHLAPGDPIPWAVRHSPEAMGFSPLVMGRLPGKARGVHGHPGKKQVSLTIARLPAGRGSRCPSRHVGPMRHLRSPARGDDVGKYHHAASVAVGSSGFRRTMQSAGARHGPGRAEHSVHGEPSLAGAYDAQPRTNNCPLSRGKTEPRSAG